MTFYIPSIDTVAIIRTGSAVKGEVDSKWKIGLAEFLSSNLNVVVATPMTRANVGVEETRRQSLFRQVWIVLE